MVGRPALDPRFGALLVALTIAPALVIAVLFLQAFSADGSPQRPFTDALTYLAAGDRLNLGHDLYRLRPGDLPVDLYPALFPAPMVGPPTMGVIARPFAAVDVGLALWVASSWAALLGAVAYLVVRVGLLAVAVCIALSMSIGEQLAAGNVASFFPLLLIVAWRRRGTAAGGVAVGLMAGAKLAPIALAGWLLGTRDGRGIVGLTATLVALAVGVVLFAGWENVVDYGRVASIVSPSEWSVSSAVGVSWASYVVLVGGSLLAIGTARWPRVSFGVGILAMTFGTPALYWSGLVALLGVLAPLTDSDVFARYRFLPTRSTT
ncbi:MAG: glycosyltransferase family 87 protein [Candidatus Limnocylindria bacterium]